MTNYERLLDLPLREVLKEFGKNNKNSAKLRFGECMPYLVVCDGFASPCNFCNGGSIGSCQATCEIWLDAESAPDANFNEDVWREFDKELPFTLDASARFLCCSKELGTISLLWFNGEYFVDEYNIVCSKVTHWRPLPKLPEGNDVVQ